MAAASKRWSHGRKACGDCATCATPRGVLRLCCRVMSFTDGQGPGLPPPRGHRRPLSVSNTYGYVGLCEKQASLFAAKLHDRFLCAFFLILFAARC